MRETILHFDNNFNNAPWVLDQIALYQAGDRYMGAGSEMGTHTQWCDEITYVISGEAQITVDTVTYPVKTGDLIFSPKGAVHRIVSSKENPMRYFYLGYMLIDTHPQIERWKPVATFLTGMKKHICHNASNMMHLFSDLLGEFQHNFEKRDMLIELSILQILLYTYKYFSGGQENPAVYEKRVPDKQELVYIITSYIDNHISQIKALTDVSDYIGFSYSYTSQIFRSIMDMSLKTYYQNKRFEEAAKLLQNGLSVTQTSEALGFESVHSFSRAFKTQFGVSPQSYTRQKKMQ